MEAYMRQGDLDVSIGYKVQTTFGFNETLVFSLEGIGTTMLCSFLMLNRPLGVFIGLLVVAAAVALLFAHLGHPEKAWRAFRCLKTSWISRGTAFVSGFLAVAVIYLLATLSGHLAAGSGWDVVLKIILLATGLVVLVYPGFALAYAPSIPFWNSGLLPVSFVLSGLTAGISWVIACPAMTGGFSTGTIGSIWLWVQLVLLGLLLVSVVVYVISMGHGVAAARESTQHLLRGEAMFMFVFVSCAIGIAVPIALSALSWGGGGLGVALLMVSAMARTIGDIALRRTLVKVGMYDPVY